MKAFFQCCLVLLLASGCNTALRPDYEGLRCDPGNVCPPGFDCTQGVCRGRADGGSCTVTSCTTPPTPQCQDANTRRSFTGGTCNTATGQCQWTSQDTTCAQGCANGLCIGDPCNGVSCTTPPAPTCVDASTLRVYANSGTCDSSTGACSYTSSTTTCVNGCSNGACVNQNLCNGVTCNSPPAPSCSGSSRITFTSPGTCNPGTGQCSYNQVSTTCPNGCANGVCNAAPLTFTQTHPKVRHQVNAIDQAPTSSGNRVIAVGPFGAISVFDGGTWGRLDAGTTQDLTAVWASGFSTAWVVGKNRTVLRVNASGVFPVPNVPVSGSTNFVAVHGTRDDDVVMADETGGVLRFRAGNWTPAALSSAANMPYAMRALWVDGLGRARVAGRCQSGTASAKGCVFYNSPDSGTWYEDIDNSTATTEGFLAVGPTPATVVTNEAWVGTFPTAAMKRHDGVNGNYDSTGVPTLPAANGVVGITGTAPGALTRATFVLTGVNNTTPSSLYRATAVGLDSGGALFDFYFNLQSLSRTESGGVIVADSRTTTTPAVNDIIRRGPVTNEALDLGEDWVAADQGTFAVGPAGSSVNALVLVSAYNDLAVRPATGGSRFVFRRGPYAEVTDVVAGNGSAGISGRSASLYKFTILGGFTKALVSPSTVNDFNALCRASDSELYVVGNGGVIYAWNLNGVSAASATQMTSPTANNLLDVHCPVAGSAVACGQNGTVLVLRNGNWSAVTPAFPNATATLTSCKQVGGAVFVAGDGVFAVFQSGAWTNLPNRAQLSDLVPLSATDIYAASGSQLFRFDGANWSTNPVFTAPQVLRAGGQLGARVVYAGGAGVVVESQ